MPKIQLPFTNNYEKISSFLKKYSIATIPIVKKSMDSVIKLGKDKSDKWDQTGVVCKFSCNNCPVSYIGETKRFLKTRINEHRTKNKNIESVVHVHENTFNHEFIWDDTKILDIEHDYKRRLISEMIHIKCNRHSINRKEDIHTLNRAYFPLFSKFKYGIRLYLFVCFDTIYTASSINRCENVMFFSTDS